jgi:hypothetical protein
MARSRRRGVAFFRETPDRFAFCGKSDPLVSNFTCLPHPIGFEMDFRTQAKKFSMVGVESPSLPQDTDGTSRPITCSGMQLARLLAEVPELSFI